MPVHPTKPVFLGIIHEEGPVKEAMEHFKKALSGKARLYIEGSPGILHSDRNQYKPLVEYAESVGVKVVPLDTDLRDREFKNIRAHVLRDLDDGDLIKGGELYGLFRHREFSAREKAWAEALRGASARSIVVMHPIHAERMVERMGIPAGNFVYKDPVTGKQMEEAFIGDLSTGKFESLRRKRRAESHRK